MSKELTPMDLAINELDQLGINISQEVKIKLLQSESSFIRKKEREAASKAYEAGEERGVYDMGFYKHPFPPNDKTKFLEENYPL
jgi:hypothetical protein